MRLDLLGLEADEAVARLGAEGVSPQLTQTCAPRREHEERGTLRVVYASDDGTRLTVARFLDPLLQQPQAEDRKNREDDELNM